MANLVERVEELERLPGVYLAIGEQLLGMGAKKF